MLKATQQAIKMSNVLKILFPPLHKEGIRFLAIFICVTLIACLINETLFALCFLLTIWCYYFFRDPQRQVPQSEDIVVSPADGVVCAIDEAIPPGELELGGTPMQRIGIFMNAFNCHVNRAPVTGTIKEVQYHKGQFLNASTDKASEKNERNSIVIMDDHGDNYVVVQIAGFLARRIVCEVAENEALSCGERFGIIRFGSRVDVYLPEKMTPQLALGQIMVAGETIIARSKNVSDTAYKTV
ncbi:MAG: phosphatidylserine decarboxylase [Pseudomonadota bacterium]